MITVRASHIASVNIHSGNTFWKDYTYVDNKYDQKSEVSKKKKENKQSQSIFF